MRLLSFYLSILSIPVLALQTGLAGLTVAQSGPEPFIDPQQPVASVESAHGTDDERKAAILVTDAEISAMDLSDPKLRSMYRAVMSGNSDPLRKTQYKPGYAVIIADMRRRGDSITPLMLDIMVKNPNSQLESCVTPYVSRLKTLSMRPYLEYWKQRLVDRKEGVFYGALKLKYSRKELPNERFETYLDILLEWITADSSAGRDPNLTILEGLHHSKVNAFARTQLNHPSESVRVMAQRLVEQRVEQVEASNVPNASTPVQDVRDSSPPTDAKSGRAVSRTEVSSQQSPWLWPSLVAVLLFGVFLWRRLRQ